MGWLRIFLLMITASALIDQVAWKQITWNVQETIIPAWIVLRGALSFVILFWLSRACGIPKRMRKRIREQAAKKAYDEMYAIAEQAAQH